MKFGQKIFLLLACVSLFNCFNLIQDTYAKYSSNADASADITIAKWNILVNNQDIKNSKDFSNTIIPVFTGTDNISNGVIAPTAEGYFDITVNSTNVDVSYLFNMNINVSNDSAVKDLVITGYSINNGSVVSLNSSNYSITDSVNYKDTVRIKTYRFFVKWDDSENATMSNIDDTNATTSSGKAKFNVVTSFIQNANN